MTEPYYDDGTVTIFHGDCREILPLEPGGAVRLMPDVIITDPPYAVRWADAPCAECGNDYPTGAYDLCSDCIETFAPGPRPTEMLGFVSPNWDAKATHSRGYADHDPEAFAELLGLAWRGAAASVPPGALMVAFCGNRTFAEMVTAAADAGWSMLDVLVFASRGGVAKSKTTLRPDHELAALMRTKGPVREINPDWKAGNLWEIDKGPKMESSHLTTKPLAWMHRLVERFAEPGAVVLDPFMGSGTTLRAAKDMGRLAIGIEVDEAYCELAARRCSQEVLAL